MVWHAVRCYKASLSEALRLAIDDRLDLALLHLPVPHSPFIREAITGSRRLRGYIGNLVVADEAFGEICGALESAGLWGRSVVIITSDHWWRSSIAFDGKKDLRVPFLVRFPGQSRSAKYEKPFNTIIVHDLVYSILDGQIGDSDSLMCWLDEKGTYQLPTKV